MVRLQSNHFNINETASKVEFHVEWQVELQGVKEVGWVDENLTQCWVRSPIFGYRMETTHLKKSLGIKKNWVFVLAYTKCGPINPNYEEYMFPSGNRLHNDFHLLRLEGSTLAAFYGESHLPSGHLLHTAKMAMKIVDIPSKNGDCP